MYNNLQIIRFRICQISQQPQEIYNGFLYFYFNNLQHLMLIFFFWHRLCSISTRKSIL